MLVRIDVSFGKLSSTIMCCTFNRLETSFFYNLGAEMFMDFFYFMKCNHSVRQEVENSKLLNKEHPNKFPSEIIMH